MKNETIDLVFSFDTTGSMYPCLTQVRRSVEEVTRELFKRIPNLRIGVIAHGDYCDGGRAISKLELTDDIARICKFIQTAPATSGGDADECYELVLHDARSMNWTAGTNKALVLIGDANPHPVGYQYGSTRNSLSWQTEAKLLGEAGISVYPVQALGRSGSTRFYQTLAEIAGTPKLDLPQFSDIVDIISAICYRQAGPEQLEQFTKEVKVRKVKPSANLLITLDLLAGRKLSKKSETVGSRFQVLDVSEDCSIKQFVEDNGLVFKKGRGFYEFTKSETIQEYKEVVAQNRETGAILDGSRARKALGIPEGRVTAKPDNDSKYLGFVQSTSMNRKLKGGTKFLYEISDE